MVNRVMRWVARAVGGFACGALAWQVAYCTHPNYSAVETLALGIAGGGLLYAAVVVGSRGE